MKYVLTVLTLLLSGASIADWHHGKLTIFAIGYDGKTVSVGQAGFSKSDCTCYPAWPNRYCLDPNRDTFDQEYALLLSAKARDISVAINIDETTCRIVAIYEP